MEPPTKKMRLLVKKIKNRSDTPHCTSPSHFLVQEQFLKMQPDQDASRSKNSNHSKALIYRRKVDNILDAVATLYYHPTHVCRPRSSSENPRDLVEFLRLTADVGAANSLDRTVYSAADSLISPYFEPSIFDTWTTKEIMLFEAGITSLGKDFHAIQKLIPTKTTKELVHFFYFWKQSAHYAMWKAFDKPSRPLPSGKQEQWTLVARQLYGDNKNDNPTQKSESADSSESSSAATTSAPPAGSK
eukprot:gb/GEZN01016860.1/.p1 GENE.gb/GEZN01016860.1/~~gb/GEZN01016860.1/.p1  ORF type:complete len:244 (-),score=26.01 gb/GEZN01016860.1/:47-778(-)